MEVLLHPSSIRWAFSKQCPHSKPLQSAEWPRQPRSVVLAEEEEVEEWDKGSVRGLLPRCKRGALIIHPSSCNP